MSTKDEYDIPPTYDLLELACYHGNEKLALELLERKCPIKDIALTFYYKGKYFCNLTFYYAVKNKLNSVILILWDRVNWTITASHRMTGWANMAVDYVQDELRRTVIEQLNKELSVYFTGYELREYMSKIIREYTIY